MVIISTFNATSTIVTVRETLMTTAMSMAITKDTGDHMQISICVTMSMVMHMATTVKMATTTATAMVMVMAMAMPNKKSP
jgi:hypothetical protein